jgi:hypothetical protein
LEFSRPEYLRWTKGTVLHTAADVHWLLLYDKLDSEKVVASTEMTIKSDSTVLVELVVLEYSLFAQVWDGECGALGALASLNDRFPRIYRTLDEVFGQLFLS